MPTMTMTNTLYQELEQAAKMTGWTTTAVLEAALRRYFAELREDAEDAARAEKAWNDFVARGEKAIPAEELYQELGL